MGDEVPFAARVTAAEAAGVEGVRVDRGGGRVAWLHPETGQLHRLGGPAEEGVTQAWWVAGVRHRLDGPAEVTPGFEQWWRHGLVHRADGPAAEHVNGKRTWVVDGDVVTNEDDWAELSRLYDYGHGRLLEQVMAVWRPDGPPVVDLVVALEAAYA